MAGAAVSGRLEHQWLAFPRRVALWVRHLPIRLREREFWTIQLIIGAVTAVHYTTELLLPFEPFLGLHHTPVILYIIPIAYAAVRYGWEGGLCTSGWVVMLVAPSMAGWHTEDWMWLGELVRVVLVIAVGLVLSYRVEREARLRRLAEDSSARLRVLVQQTTKAQEEERARIARELHDDTLQTMVLISRELRDIADHTEPDESGSPGLQRARVDRMAVLASRSAESLRTFSRDLRPSVLDDLGLCAALEWLTDDLSRRTEVRAECTMRGDPRRLDPNLELALFRIAQEALRNVEKHARAKNVRIEIVLTQRQVTLTVRDDGVGFSAPSGIEQLVSQGKLGLAGIKERAWLVGGRLDVESGPGKGSLVRAVVPARN